MEHEAPVSCECVVRALHPCESAVSILNRTPLLSRKRPSIALIESTALLAYRPCAAEYSSCADTRFRRSLFIAVT